MSLDVAAWASRVAGGDAAALARALSLVEGRAEHADALLAALYEQRKAAWRIGVTGPPGSGKSTLVAALIGALRQRGERVAVLAVDPTSPFTGGAILADRVRMLDHAEDEHVYVRSMASRGSLGGLAPAAADALTVLEAAAFDVILIETVGVGQAEVDVASLADCVALVLAPGAGDDMQAMKAGVMEIAGAYVLNKADAAGADLLEQHLRALLSLRSADAGPAPPILRTVATRGEGAAELLDGLRELPVSADAPRLYWRRRLAEALSRGLAEVHLPRLAPPEALDRAAAEVAAGRLNPYAWVKQLLHTADES